jgi:hypothetical protein
MSSTPPARRASSRLVRDLWRQRLADGGIPPLLRQRHLRRRRHAEASQLLLRVYLEKRERKYRAPLDKAIQFVLDAQYANGGWPQRFPFVENGGVHGHADYTPYITFNDDVAGENIEFLLYAHQALGSNDARLVDAIERGMDIYVKTQQPMPQPAWGLQHFPDTLKPAPPGPSSPRPSPPIRRRPTSAR